MSRLVRTSSWALALAVASGANAQELVNEVFGNGAGGLLGSTVSGVGDVNGDGFADVAVAAPSADTPAVDAGRVRIYSGPTATVLVSIDGAAAGDRFGQALAGVGDVNGDGTPDLLVGAPFATQAKSSEGVVQVRSGVDGSVILSLAGGNPFDWFGSSVDAAGDLDNDGVVDFLIGAPAPSQVGAGFEYVRAHSGATGQVIHTFYADPLDDAQFGYAVAGGTDIDGDGVGDILIGERNYGVIFDGRVHILSGLSGALIDRVDGVAAEKLGSSVAWFSDVTGDDVPEILVGGPGFQSSAGRVRVLSGADRSVVYSMVGSANEQLGYSLAALGDQDGDLVDDFLAGAPGGALLGVATGEVHVYSGADGSKVAELSGGSSAVSYGWDLAATGDITGDARPDFVVGSPYDDSLAVNGGTAAWYDGGCGGGAITSYGSGCAGSGGFVPTLEFSGCAKAGGVVTVTVANGLGGSQAFLFIGFGPAAIPLDGGCVLNLAVPVVSVVGPVPLFGSGPGAGKFMISPTLPSNATAGTAYFTAACVDPGTFQGYTTTNGVEVQVNVDG